MQENENHFIKNIEIKNFKCFDNFKAEGFARVNLIGGKNNVGKTAFMEACFLTSAENIYSFYNKFLEIKTHRDVINNLLLKSNREEDLKKIILDSIDIHINRKEKVYDKEYKDIYNCGVTWIRKDKNSKELLNLLISIHTFNIDKDSFLEIAVSDAQKVLDENIDNSKMKFSINFISPYSNSNQELENIIGQSKLDNKYENINQYLLEVFNVSSIDIIKNKPMLKSNGEYRELSHFGQGIKTFINIISSILLLEDDIIFIDEIENGIHYTNLDKLWEIILTISKQQNVQVFATTHSKEAIESYYRVAKKLEDKDITYSIITKLKSGKLHHSLYNYALIENSMEQEHEVRGW